MRPGWGALSCGTALPGPVSAGCSTLSDNRLDAAPDNNDFRSLVAMLVRKAGPPALLGLGIGAFLVYRSTGKFWTPGLIGGLLLTGIIIVFVAFAAGAGASNGKQTWKVVLDVLSIITGLIALLFPWCVYLGALCFWRIFELYESKIYHLRPILGIIPLT